MPEMWNSLATVGSLAAALVSFAGEAGQLLWRRWAGGWRFAMATDVVYVASGTCGGEADIGGIESRLADALMAQSPFAISSVSVRFG
jgi:hypothetical protein